MAPPSLKAKLSLNVLPVISRIATRGAGLPFSWALVSPTAAMAPPQPKPEAEEDFLAVLDWTQEAADAGVARVGATPASPPDSKAYSAEQNNFPIIN